MNRTFRYLLGALACIAIGCNKQGGSSSSSSGSAGSQGSVAVVNVDRVGEAMGWADQMRKALTAIGPEENERMRQFNDRVTAAKNDYDLRRKEVIDQQHIAREQLDAARSREDLQKLGLTAQQIETLFRASTHLNRERQAASEGEQELNQRRNQLGTAFGDALRAAIRRAAANSGKTVVFTAPMANLTYYDVSADLTDEVIKELQKMPPVTIAVPALTSQPATQPSATQAATLPEIQPNTQSAATLPTTAH